MSSVTKAQHALHALSPILQIKPPPSLSSSPNLALALLHDTTTISSSITTLLRNPNSGSGDNPLCRWLYETFNSGDPTLQLVVYSYIPLLTSQYLTRVKSTRHLSGFEAILLSIYSHETISRRSPITITIPKLSNPSIYHETAKSKAKSTDLHVGILSHAVEPHSMLRSACRARMVGVALEGFNSKIRLMPIRSKVDFCDVCEIWAREIGLSWEIMQPCLRILGHCLMENEELYKKARNTWRSLYIRASHDIDAKAILATQSLIRMIELEKKMEIEEVDYTELPRTRIISI